MVLKPLRGPPPPGIKTTDAEVLIVPVNLQLKQGAKKSVALTSWADEKLKKSVLLKDDEQEGKGNTYELLGLVPPPATTPARSASTSGSSFAWSSRCP